MIVELGGLFRGSASVLRRKWSEVGAVAALQSRTRASAWPGVLPDVALVEAAVLALSGRSRQGPIVVGPPAACAALEVWRPALDRSPTRVDEPAPLPSAPGTAVVALLGAHWVDEVVDRAVASGHRVGVACPAVGGERVDPPARGAWIADAWAGEGTRGVLGAGVLTAAGLAGLPVAAALEGAGSMWTLCDGPVAANPAWSLARALRLLAVERHRDAVTHVAGGAALEPFVAWAARAQAHHLATPSATTTPRPLPAIARAGCDDWAYILTRGTPERVIIAWVIGGDPGAAGWLDAVEQVGPSVIRVRLPGTDAASLAAASALWLRTLGALAALEDRTG